MCCFFATLLFFGPRLAFLIYWLIAPLRVRTSFAAFNLPILVGILGLVFAPFFTLMYVLVFPLNGYDWFWLGLALAIDVAGYIGGDRNRHKVPGYSNMMPGDVPPSSSPPPAAMAAPMAAPMSQPAQTASGAMPPGPPAPTAPDAMPPSAPAPGEGEEK